MADMALAIVDTAQDLDAWVTGYEGSLEDLACDLANRYLTGDGLVGRGRYCVSRHRKTYIPVSTARLGW